ncbi:MAG: prephenate dehydratase [Spirochaetes bacterium]|jgi:prephenate dehydratase/chorismate mutase|nr:prephenate dehydratase [Spirochaetota bacterium]
MILSDIRKKIDLKDAQILKLLHERMELAVMSKKFKSSIEDSSREEELLERLEAHSGVLINPEFSKKLYKDIIRESKRLQEQEYKLIGFQGEQGAYQELASLVWNKELIPTACATFSEVFSGVESGLYDYGIVPIENTLGGVVSQTNDLMIHSNLFVVGAVELEIHHCLMALPGTDHRDIRLVYSHQQALAQCRNFLSRHNLEGVSFYNTAGAAKMLMQEKPKASAVIASRLAADIYNLEIIKENIEDLDTNRTRFLIISKEENSVKGEKCSVLFSTAHKAGTLFHVLEIFAKESINLTRIESIPNKPGTYVFFLDFEGDKNDPKVQNVLNQMCEITGEFRFMGCYKEIHD